MFYDSAVFNQPIGNWNTSSVTNMSNMFQQAGAFNQPIANWNTGSVTNMAAMFLYATAFNQPIGNWNTGSVTNMSGLFNGATAFNQPIGSWNTGSVTQMQGMFQSAISFNQPIGNWNVATVTNMNSMFDQAHAFDQNLGAWALRTGVNLSAMLNYSGLSCENYDYTLIGWAANPATPINRILGAFGKRYWQGVTARNQLTTVKGWVISGDIFDNCNYSLPLILGSFEALPRPQHVLLRWQTLSEYELSDFEIERSADAQEFVHIGGLAARNSPEGYAYTFVDAAPLNGRNHYRLKLNKPNGADEYGPVVEVLFESASQLRLYPNPASDRIFIESSTDIKIEWYSASGQLVGRNALKAGKNELSVAHFSPGLYFYRSNAGHSGCLTKL